MLFAALLILVSVCGAMNSRGGFGGGNPGASLPLFFAGALSTIAALRRGKLVDRVLGGLALLILAYWASAVAGYAWDENFWWDFKHYWFGVES